MKGEFNSHRNDDENSDNWNDVMDVGFIIVGMQSETSACSKHNGSTTFKLYNRPRGKPQHAATSGVQLS